MPRLFKFHATSLASNQSSTPSNAIKCQSNRLSHWSARIIPVFFVLRSLGKFRLSRSYKMPIIGESTTCKVFSMGDVITPSHLRQLLYLPVYKSIPCISRPPILEPKNKFFLFLCQNFLEKLLFYLRISSQIRYDFMNKNHRKLGRRVYYLAQLSIYACFSDTSISCIFFIIF